MGIVITETMRLFFSLVVVSILVANSYSFHLRSDKGLEEGEDFACSCPTLLLSSLSQAARDQPQTLGIYKRLEGKEYSQRSVYRGPTSSVLYFSVQPSYSCWMVGPQLGSLSGFIHNPSQDFLCPYLLPQGWKFFSAANNEWLIDPSLVLRCITEAKANNRTEVELFA